MPKKKVFAARNLKDCLPNLQLKKGKAKKKIKVFLSRQFCDSLTVGKNGAMEFSVIINRDQHGPGFDLV
jgi:hypothetical protein